MYTPTTSTEDSLADSKYTVAGILSSMANGHGLSPFSDPGLSFGGAVTSVSSPILTPMLTPTTLANLEQTFIELTAVQTQPSTGVTDLTTTVSSQLPGLGGDLRVTQARQSGFVPPVVAVDPSIVPKSEPYYQDESSSDQEWYSPASKRPRTDVTGSAILIAPDSTTPRRRTPGPRRSRNEHLTPEEEARRMLRRERNKLAAAKCRQRRVDQTNTLINETEILEDEKASLETEVESLQQVKEHLEFVLEAHRPHCSVKHVHVKQECLTAAPSSCTSSSVNSTTRPTSLSLASTSLSLTSTTHSFAASTLATGVPITTPSSIITTLGLDNLIDHTGLTPLTGGATNTGLTPLIGVPSNCSSELQRSSDGSSSGEGMHSPTLILPL